MTFPPISALFLFPAIVLFLEAGRRLRRRRPLAEPSSAVEGAVFGLFGLLLAFTFSGAVARYDAHRALLTEEVNDIGTAYLRLDLLPPAARPPLRRLFRDYTTSRLHLFDSPQSGVSSEAARLQSEIWQRSLAAATSAGAGPDAAKLLLPALNTMIDITSTRENAFKMHPPAVVLLLLFAFAGVCAFMAGYSPKVGLRDWIYTVVLATCVTLTVYAILEIEYPRRGLIRLSHLDQQLVTLRDSME